MATEYSGDFARVLPVNQLAKRLFSRCYMYAKEADPFHLNFMVPLPHGQPVANDEPFESSTDYDSHYSDDIDINETLQWGSFILSFEESRWPEFHHLGLEIWPRECKISEPRRGYTPSKAERHR